MKTLILGMGEIGRALEKVLSLYYPVMTKDVSNIHNGEILKEIDVMHVCFPYGKFFVDEVKKYQNDYLPNYTVIHSTVPVGTSSKLESIHSPVRGKHPNLEEGIRTFPKFLGGSKASEVADYFRRAGMKVILFDKSETTEALKLFDTEYYRVCIEFAQRVKRYCDRNSLNFSEIYTIPNITYNESYTRLGNPEFIRPVLQPIMTPIGGHCVIPNSKLIKDEK